MQDQPGKGIRGKLGTAEALAVSNIDVEPGIAEVSDITKCAGDNILIFALAQHKEIISEAFAHHFGSDA